MLKKLVLIALALGFSNAAFAGPPTKFLQKQVTDVRTQLAKNAKPGTPEGKEVDEALKKILDPLMEFDKLSEKALGKHWATLNAAQRDEFIKLFHDLVFESYMSKVRAANEDYRISYEDEEAQGQKSAIVTAVAKTKKAEIELAFHLAARAQRVWVAEDIVIDEVSLVDNYREQFNKIIAEDGYNALLKKMRDKLDELTRPDRKAKAAPAAPAAQPAAKPK